LCGCFAARIEISRKPHLLTENVSGTHQEAFVPATVVMIGFYFLFALLSLISSG
jgi:hypothetical protein